MNRYYKFTGGKDKQFSTPRPFVFKGDKMRAEVRDMEGPGWIVTAFQEDLEVCET